MAPVSRSGLGRDLGAEVSRQEATGLFIRALAPTPRFDRSDAPEAEAHRQGPIF